VSISQHLVEVRSWHAPARRHVQGVLTERASEERSCLSSTCKSGFARTWMPARSSSSPRQQLSASRDPIPGLTSSLLQNPTSGIYPP